MIGSPLSRMLAPTLLVVALLINSGCAGRPRPWSRPEHHARSSPEILTEPAPAADPARRVSDLVASSLGVRTGPGITTAGATGAAGPAAPAPSPRRPVGVSTILAGDVALIGFDPGGPTATAPSVGPAPGPGSADAGGLPGPAGLPMEDYLRARVLTAFPELKEAYVTTDPALVGRIARLSAKLQTGDPAGTHQAEIDAIARAMGVPGPGR